MNDLAEKALHGLDTARRQVTDRPVAALAIAGFVVSAAVVAAGGVEAATRPTRVLSGWLGLQDDHGLTSRALAPATLLLLAVVLLVLLWLAALEIVRRTEVPEHRIWLLVAAWSTPFAIGPPLMDTAAYASAAFGFVQRAGHDPYTNPPSSLGADTLVDAVDPAARGTVSAAGPLGSMLQHLAPTVAGGTALGAVLVLRVLGVLAAIAITRLAAEIAGAADTDSVAGQRRQAMVLAGLNPLLLFYVVSSPHVDGPMTALVLAALLAARRRRWSLALGLAALAGSVSPQAFVVVPVLLAVHVAGRRRAPVWLVLARDVAVAGVVAVAAGLLQPHGFGWLGALSEQFAAHTPYAAGNAAGRLLAPIVQGASYDDLATAGRISAAAAGVCTVAYLLVSARHRPVERTAGFALLALALLAPNLYPWYLTWGLLCLVPGATGERRRGVIALAAAGCVLVPPGFADTSATVVTGVGLAVVAAVALVVAARARGGRVSAAE
ncbi:alpha-1,6-mannosyltransferase [Jatrophihabitans endophyticus]|uniref:Alpha-1,6-mannosyltransferase n=1 Tax=Jatrophihabitans endophyticus TaxID=1206085 RepID=A0A1M5IVD6_9ACTN|nr:hypothetical protein [Jatrophihabitans endophyticus]SHG32125.1 alpha-1,6-mannosyltransferase [Jatrophihabitans endophyticus]